MAATFTAVTEDFQEIRAKEGIQIARAGRDVGLGCKAVNHARDIKLRFERKSGELLRETVQHDGCMGKAETLPQIKTGYLSKCLSRTQSSRWQALAPSFTFRTSGPSHALNIEPTANPNLARS